jgi:hypothetical protein
MAAATASIKEVQLNGVNALIWSSKHPPCKMQANRHDGSRPTVREQDHLKTPPSLLHVNYIYLRGLCENAPRSRAESHLGWVAVVVRPFGCFEFPQRRKRRPSEM